MVIDRVISECLKENGRRVIIPEFGAFISREEGKVAFLAILKNDDGVLVSEVGRQLGYSEAEAAEAVRKYSAALRRELSEGRTATIKGVGRITPGEAGKYLFEPEGDAVAPASPGPGAAKVVSSPEIAEKELAERLRNQQSATRQVEEQAPRTQPATVADRAASSLPAETKQAAGEKVEPERKIEAEQKIEAERKVEPELKIERVPMNTKAETTQQAAAAPARKEAAQPASKPQAAQQVAGTAQGVATGTAQGSATRATHGNVAGTAQSNATGATQGSAAGLRPTIISSQQAKPVTTGYNMNIRRPAKRKRMDSVMVIALIAMAIALGVLVYGWVVGQSYTIDLNDMLQ